MSYDKFTCSYFDKLPSRKRLQFDFDYLQDHAPDYLYHFACGLCRIVIVRNFDSKGFPSSYSLKVIGYPPAVGVWRSIFTSPVLHDVIHAFSEEVNKFTNFTSSVPGDWYVSEL